jgi:hypothetical protein
MIFILTIKIKNLKVDKITLGNSFKLEILAEKPVRMPEFRLELLAWNEIKRLPIFLVREQFQHSLATL